MAAMPGMQQDLVDAPDHLLDDRSDVGVTCLNQLDGAGGAERSSRRVRSEASDSSLRSDMLRALTSFRRPSSSSCKTSWSIPLTPTGPIAIRKTTSAAVTSGVGWSSSRIRSCPDADRCVVGARREEAHRVLLRGGGHRDAPEK